MKFWKIYSEQTKKIVPYAILQKFSFFFILPILFLLEAQLDPKNEPSFKENYDTFLKLL